MYLLSFILTILFLTARRRGSKKTFDGSFGDIMKNLVKMLLNLFKPPKIFHCCRRRAAAAGIGLQLLLLQQDCRRHRFAAAGTGLQLLPQGRCRCRAAATAETFLKLYLNKFELV